jgi:hypothetical protein
MASICPVGISQEMKFLFSPKLQLEACLHVGVEI